MLQLYVCLHNVNVHRCTHTQVCIHAYSTYILVVLSNFGMLDGT